MKINWRIIYSIQNFHIEHTRSEHDGGGRVEIQYEQKKNARIFEILFLLVSIVNVALISSLYPRSLFLSVNRKSSLRIHFR